MPPTTTRTQTEGLVLLYNPYICLYLLSVNAIIMESSSSTTVTANDATNLSTIQSGIQELHGHLSNISDADSSIGILFNKINELTEFENGALVEQSDEIVRLDRLQNDEPTHSKEDDIKKCDEIIINELKSERIKLLHDLETYKEQNDQLTYEITVLRDTVSNITQRVETEVKHAIDAQTIAEHDKKVAEERATIAETQVRTELLMREEMERVMSVLYTEKISLTSELEDVKETLQNCVCKNSKMDSNNNTSSGEEIMRLKREIHLLRGENASLRELNDEIRSGSQSASHQQQNQRQHAAAAQSQAQAAVTRKRALVLSQGSVGEESREYKRSIHYEPHRERFGSSTGSGSLEMIDGTAVSLGGSGSTCANRERLDTAGSDTISALHEADNVSLLFGQDSVDKKDGDKMSSKKDCGSDGIDNTKSENHDGIRAHAEKLLYWANKATVRSKKGGSVASKQGCGGTPFNTPNKHHSRPSSLSSSIPMTIGLPPRSESRVQKSRLLPPRCPTPPVSIAAASTAASSSSSSQEDCNNVLSDKENEGALFNQDEEVPGAFPKLPKSKDEAGKKIVSLSAHDTIIDDYTNNEQQAMNFFECSCSVSPFSGNDIQSKFYLPRLGLACKCAGVTYEDDRVNFSRNPTALSNILRQWQCEFLSTVDIDTADSLLRAHKHDANDLARKMKKWRVKQGCTAFTRSKECYIALKIWSRTCKVVLRSIKEQKEQAKQRAESVGGDEEHQQGIATGDDGVIIEKPHFLDISFAADTHTITSISTLGQFSSVGGGRPFEMMEI